MDLLHGNGDRFVVVDTETTGLYNNDRIVEVAAVTVSPHGRIVDEWDTLVNPERDIGPTHRHRITASMVSAAPTFDEVAAALAERLNGAVLVAHNLTFDARMLTNEYHRMDGHLEPGSGICTLRMCGQRLEDACRHRGIPLEYPHRALADARATARLLRAEILAYVRDVSPVSITLTSAAFRPRTLRRDMTLEPDDQMPYLARLADRTHHYGVHDTALVYMDMLDWVLCDLVVTTDEQARLRELAVDLGLNADDIGRIHRRYVDELVEAALRDGIIQPHELLVLEGAALALGLDSGTLLHRLEERTQSSATIRIEAGMRVCFTGSAMGLDDQPIERVLLEQIAGDLGWAPVDGVSKKRCDVLVAADPSSQSGKAKKARSFGIPVAAVSDFLLAQPAGTLRIC
jgi:DNA polymerase III subunit epsilon